eukprot:213619-Lingulodinium_polyedra.AAC.1
MEPAWFRRGTGMAQAWRRHGAGVVLARHRRGTGVDGLARQSFPARAGHPLLFAASASCIPDWLVR